MFVYAVFFGMATEVRCTEVLFEGDFDGVLRYSRLLTGSVSRTFGARRASSVGLRGSCG